MHVRIARRHDQVDVTLVDQAADGANEGARPRRRQQVPSVGGGALEDETIVVAAEEGEGRIGSPEAADEIFARRRAGADYQHPRRHAALGLQVRRALARDRVTPRRRPCRPG